MKSALIILGVIAIAFIAIEVVGSIIVRCAKARFDRMSLDEQRKQQEAMYKHQQMGI